MAELLAFLQAVPTLYKIWRELRNAHQEDPGKFIVDSAAMEKAMMNANLPKEMADGLKKLQDIIARPV